MASLNTTATIVSHQRSQTWRNSRTRKQVQIGDDDNNKKIDGERDTQIEPDGKSKSSAISTATIPNIENTFPTSTAAIVSAVPTSLVTVTTPTSAKQAKTTSSPQPSVRVSTASAPPIVVSKPSTSISSIDTMAPIATPVSPRVPISSLLSTNAMTASQASASQEVATSISMAVQAGIALSVVFIVFALLGGTCILVRRGHSCRKFSLLPSLMFRSRNSTLARSSDTNIDHFDILERPSEFQTDRSKLDEELPRTSHSSWRYTMPPATSSIPPSCHIPRRLEEDMISVIEAQLQYESQDLEMFPTRLAPPPSATRPGFRKHTDSLSLERPVSSALSVSRPSTIVVLMEEEDSDTKHSFEGQRVQEVHEERTLVEFVPSDGSRLHLSALPSRPCSFTESDNSDSLGS